MSRTTGCVCCKNKVAGVAHSKEKKKSAGALKGVNLDNVGYQKLVSSSLTGFKRVAQVDSEPSSKIWIDIRLDLASQSAEAGSATHPLGNQNKLLQSCSNSPCHALLEEAKPVCHRILLKEPIQQRSPLPVPRRLPLCATAAAAPAGSGPLS